MTSRDTLNMTSLDVVLMSLTVGNAEMAVCTKMLELSQTHEVSAAHSDQPFTAQVVGQVENALQILV